MIYKGVVAFLLLLKFVLDVIFNIIEWPNVRIRNKPEFCRCVQFEMEDRNPFNLRSIYYIIIGYDMNILRTDTNYKYSLF